MAEKLWSHKQVFCYVGRISAIHNIARSVTIPPS